MNYLFFLLDAILVTTLSVCITRFLKPERTSIGFILGWLIFNGIIILSGFILSPFSLLSSSLSWIILHLSVCFVAFPFLPRSQSGISTVEDLSRFIRSVSPVRLSFKMTVLIFLLTALIIILLNVFCPIPLNDDSIDYHLPRVGYYLSQGSVSAFETNDARQIYFPLNAEMIYVWIIGFTQDFRLIYLYQWITLLFTALYVYSVCRSIDFSPKLSAITSFYWLAIPLVVMQAAVIKNDLLVTFYTISALVFLLSLEKSPTLSILGLSLSVSLAVGTKYNGLMSAFGIFVALSYCFFINKDLRKYTVYTLVTLVLSLFLLGSYSYGLTFLRTGSPIAQFGQASSFQPEYFFINSLRLIAEMTDSVAVLNEDIAPKINLDLPDVRQPLFQALSSISFFNIYDETNLWKSSYYPSYNLGQAKYEFSLGAFVLLLWGFFYSLLRKWSSLPVRLILLAFLFGFIPQVSLLSWQNHNLRFYLPLLTLLFPLSAYGVQRILNKKFISFLVNLSYGLGLLVLIYFYSRFRLMDCLTENPQQLFNQWIIQPGQIQELVGFLNSYSPDMTIAIHGASTSYELLLMGFDFQREVIPIPSMLSEADVEKLFQEHPNLQMVITSSALNLSPPYQSLSINSSLKAVIKTD